MCFISWFLWSFSWNGFSTPTLVGNSFSSKHILFFPGYTAQNSPPNHVCLCRIANSIYNSLTHDTKPKGLLNLNTDFDLPNNFAYKNTFYIQKHSMGMCVPPNLPLVQVCIILVISHIMHMLMYPIKNILQYIHP